MLELSSHCNMACSYCYHSEKNKKSLPFSLGYMSKGLAKKLIKEGADLGVHSIKFNARGEATLNPDYTEILTYARRLSKGLTYIDRIANSNFKISPSKRELVFKGLSTLTKVKVSYDSFYSDVFKAQRTGGNHSLTTENIDLFYNSPERIKSETQLVIQAVRTKLNKDEDIAFNVKRRWPEAEVSIRNMVEGRIDKDLGNMSLDDRSLENRKTCLQAHVRFIVHHDGKVSACCPDYKGKIVLGDANKDSIYKIFNSEKATGLRRSLKNKAAFKEDPCKTCSSYESYKGYQHSWES